MKYLILFLTLNQIIMATDFQYTTADYRKIDKNFTYEKISLPSGETCGCGEPAELLPYNGEDIPLAKTEPCLENACQKTFFAK